MKWIGQHIWDFISRFRTTVYIENLETSSEENVLVVDSDGKVTKNTTLGGSDVTMTSGVDNRVMTATGASAITGESNLTYNSSMGGLATSGAQGGGGQILITETSDNANGALLVFTSTRGGSDAQDDDVVGQIDFTGRNDGAPEVQTYGHFITYVADATDGQEAGRMEFKVAEYDGTLTTGLKLDGDTDANGEIDVTIGAGAASVTTIAGDLDIDGDNMTAAGALTFTPGGLFKTVATGVEIENGSTTGATALLIDNDDTDQFALEFHAANITQDVVKIDGRPLTTHYAINAQLANITDSGGGMKISWGDGETTSMNRLGGGSAMIHLDYDKSGNVAASNTVSAQGILLNMNNTSTSNVGTMQMYGMNFNLVHANDVGALDSYGIKGVVTGGDNNIGLQLQCSDGKGYDIKLLSSADAADYFTIQTITDGETTLQTTEGGGGSTAHMNLIADGNINLDAAGDIELNADGGSINFKDDTAILAKISTDGLSFVDNTNAGIIFEGPTDDAYQTTFTALETTSSNKTIRLPDANGVVALTSDESGGTPFNIMYGGSTKNLANTNYMTGFTNYSFATNYNSASAPTSLDHVDLMSAVFVAPRAGRISNVKIQGTDASGAGYNNPFKFYFYKGAMVSNATTASLALMDSTTSITPSTSDRTWVHTEDWSSGMDFAEDDMLFIFFKKDSSGSAQTVSFNMNLNGYLI